jgi:hypothetical protein
MRVVRRVGELKPIDGRLDVVPPEAAARLRARIGVGKTLPRGDADDSAHDRDREGPIHDRRPNTTDGACPYNQRSTTTDHPGSQLRSLGDYGRSEA